MAHNSSCGKVMFSQACVKNFVHGEMGCRHPPGQTPLSLGQTPSPQHPLPPPPHITVNKWVACILLLEHILVTACPFLQVSVCPQGGMHGCGGACMAAAVCAWLGVCVVVGGHVWLWGVCMVAGACVVVGGAWLWGVCGPESSSGAPYKVTIRVPPLVATYAGWHWATPI